MERRRIGIDTGGTFTDLVLVDGEDVRVEKLSSTPADPSVAVLEGLGRLLGRPAARPAKDGKRHAEHVVHGTTVALNALLTGRTARAALVTNAGFADLLEIARQDRPELYALHPEKPTPIVPRELCFELRARAWPDPAPAAGRALVHVDEPSATELEELARAVAAARPDSIAVCLLHAYADPAMERRVADALARIGVPITTSAGLFCEYREVERFSTAAVNAALAPVVSAYLANLSAGLERDHPGTRLDVLQSNGGTLPAADAAREPVRVLLSGPAGGVVGAARAAAQSGFRRMVGLDMGGTSTDVAFHAQRSAEHGPKGKQRGGETDDEAAPREAVPRIGGRPVAVPTLDIHTIGCGGGSLARVDAGGVLHVGPDSAGAEPGPLAWGGEAAASA